MSMQLFNVTMFVSEHAAGAVHALLRVVERPAVLALKLIVVDASSSLRKLLLSMSEATLALVSAFCRLNPILTKFSLILAICVVLDHLRNSLEGLVGVEGLLLAISVESRLLLRVVEGLWCLRGHCEALKRHRLERRGGRHEAGRRSEARGGCGHEVTRRSLEGVA